MKLVILQENLKNALNGLQKAIPAKPQLPILSSVYLQAKDNSVVLAATDLYLGIKNTLPAKVSEGGTLVIPGDIFKNLIFSLSPGEIKLETKDSSLIIEHENSRSTLPYQSAEEYPQFPEVSGQEFSISSETLKTIEKHVAFAAAVDASRPVLSSLLFSFNNQGLEIVGTDGFRLARLKTADKVDGLEQQLLLPVKPLSEVFRMISQTSAENITFKIAQELKQVLFVIDEAEIYIRLIEGEYPPYQQIIPPEFKYSISLDWQEFLTQVKRAFLFSRETSNIVKFKITKGKLTISAQSPASGEYHGEIAVAHKGEDLEIAFNALYLLDFLNTQKEGELLFSINESLKPAALGLKGEDSYSYIVMPFRAAA